MTAFAGWANFYVIVGSSAGALIGLQFVVITLIANRPIGAGQAQAGDAFGTPTIVHFGTVLLLSAILNAPRHGIPPGAVIWGLLGLSGVVYQIVVTRRVRAQNIYAPVFEDWMFHVLPPFAAYAALAVSAYTAHTHLRATLLGVASASLFLLFIGIHNAWDAVTYHVFFKKRGQHEGEP